MTTTSSPSTRTCSVVSSAVFIGAGQQLLGGAQHEHRSGRRDRRRHVGVELDDRPDVLARRVELDLQGVAQRVVGAVEDELPSDPSGDALAPRPLAAGLFERPQHIGVDAVAFGGLGGAGLGVPTGLLGGGRLRAGLLGRRRGRLACGLRRVARTVAASRSASASVARDTAASRSAVDVASDFAKRERPKRMKAMATTATTANTMTSTIMTGRY